MTVPVLPTRVHVGLLLAALALTVVGAHVAIVLFPLSGIAFLVLVGLAAQRWPLRTLAAGAIATLADPEIVPRVLPGDLGAGPIGLSEPILAMAGTVVAIEAIRSGRLVAALRDPVIVLTALFVALAVVSALVNATPPLVAVLGIVMTVDAIAMYVAVRAVAASERAAVAALGAVVASAIGLGLFGIAQVVVRPDLLGFPAFPGYFGEGGRITSLLGNPNPVAMVLALAIPFTVFGSLSMPRVRDRWLARVALVVLALALVLTFSRSAWLAVGIGVVVAALLVDWRAAVVLFVAALIAWAGFTVMPRGLAVPAPEPGSTEAPEVSRPDLVDTTVDRIDNLRGERDTRAKFTREGLPIIMDHLWLGVGPGRYGGAAATIIPSPVYQEYGASLHGFRTIHNFWQHLLGESGALGTAVFLTILAGLLIRFTRAARAAVAERRVLLAGAASVILVMGLYGFAEMIFEGNLPVLLIWLVLGIASLYAPNSSVRRPVPVAA